MVRIVGRARGFEKEQYDAKVDIRELVCGYEDFIAVLANA